MTRTGATIPNDHYISAFVTSKPNDRCRDSPPCQYLAHALVVTISALHRHDCYCRLDGIAIEQAYKTTPRENEVGSISSSKYIYIHTYLVRDNGV